MADVPDFFAIFSDPEAMRHWSFLPHEREEQSRAWVESMIGSDGRTSDDFVVTLNGRAIGKMGAYRLPEFGFLLSREHWGKGYASEALTGFVGHRRTIAPESTLIADVDPRNHRSIGLLTSHGFAETHREARTWKIGDDWCDSVYFGLKL